MLRLGWTPTGMRYDGLPYIVEYVVLLDTGVTQAIFMRMKGYKLSPSSSSQYELQGPTRVTPLPCQALSHSRSPHLVLRHLWVHAFCLSWCRLCESITLILYVFLGWRSATVSLYGLILAQVYFYFTTYRDHVLIRLVVALLWFVRISR